MIQAMINKKIANATSRMIRVNALLRNVGSRPGSGSPHFAQIFAVADTSALQRGHVPIFFPGPPKKGQFAVLTTQRNTLFTLDTIVEGAPFQNCSKPANAFSRRFITSQS